MSKKFSLKSTWLYAHILSAIAHPKNFALCVRYPFLKLNSLCTGKFNGYDVTALDFIHEGWRKAFGKAFVADVVAALKKAGVKRRDWHASVDWLDIKEKYGSLRFYAMAPGEVQDVFEKYEALSIGYCHRCGKPARYVTGGWVNYMCEECFDEHVARLSSCDDAEYKAKCRLSADDLPTFCTYENGERHEHSAKELFGVDLATLWGLEDVE